MHVILCPGLIRKNVVTNNLPEFYDQEFFRQIFSKNNHQKMFSKIVLLQSWSESFKNKEWKSSCFSIVAGPMLETLTIKMDSFASIFVFLFLKIFKNKGTTAILQISFLERKYFGIYMGVAKYLKNCLTAECVQSFLKIFNFPSV